MSQKLRSPNKLEIQTSNGEELVNTAAIHFKVWPKVKMLLLFLSYSDQEFWSTIFLSITKNAIWSSHPLIRYVQIWTNLGLKCKRDGPNPWFVRFSLMHFSLVRIFKTVPKYLVHVVYPLFDRVNPSFMCKLITMSIIWFLSDFFRPKKRTKQGLDVHG